MIDRLVGGVGLRRGRRDPDRLVVGDAVDFWRVEAIEPPTLPRLRAEMKLPGQEALFIPRGLAEHAYWRAISPFHDIAFGSVIANLAEASTERQGGDR